MAYTFHYNAHVSATGEVEGLFIFNGSSSLVHHAIPLESPITPYSAYFVCTTSTDTGRFKGTVTQCGKTSAVDIELLPLWHALRSSSPPTAVLSKPPETLALLDVDTEIEYLADLDTEIDSFLASVRRPGSELEKIFAEIDKRLGINQKPNNDDAAPVCHLNAEAQRPAKRPRF